MSSSKGSMMTKSSNNNNNNNKSKMESAPENGHSNYKVLKNIESIGGDREMSTSPLKQRSEDEEHKDVLVLKEDEEFESAESSATQDMTYASESWRVENFMHGFFVESDWWFHGEPSKKKNKAIFNCFDEPSHNNKNNHSRSNLNGHSSSSSHNKNCYSVSPKQLTDCLSRGAPAVGDFQNCGLSTWEKAREAWKKPTVTHRPPPPPPLRLDGVRSGLSQVRRTYELPGRMTLMGIVDLYLDIWDAEDGAYYQHRQNHHHHRALPYDTAAAFFCRSGTRRRRRDRV